MAKKSNKLQNVKAIKEMLDGTHKTQTKKSISFNTKSTSKSRKIGEIWTDEDGVEWEQKDGYRVKNPTRAKLMSNIRSYLAMPSDCPECNNPMEKRLDKKFYKLHKKCMDCTIEYEHKLRMAGKYKEYEDKILKDNLVSWLRDAEVEKEIIKEQLTKAEFIQANGKVEKWDLPFDPNTMKDKIDRDFEKFKSDLLDQYNVTKKGETNG